jgi:hypothetical protein
MSAVFCTVNLYVCVFMTFFTSYCFYDTYGWMDGRIDGWTDGWMDVRMCLCMSVCMCMYVCIYVRPCVCILLIFTNKHAPLQNSNTTCSEFSFAISSNSCQYSTLVCTLPTLSIQYMYPLCPVNTVYVPSLPEPSWGGPMLLGV